jgi:predicted  nucleic acid-binding Zn-ribbon protein
MTPAQELRQAMREELKELREDVKEIKKEMTSLKVKVALFSSVISSIATILVKKFTGI